MEIFPAIDLQNGQCVRLKQGDFNKATIYESDPLRVATEFAKAGASWLHVVDLDGAQSGGMKQFEIIAAIARLKLLKLQVGGGIRDAETIDKLMASGAERVVIGSLSIKNPQLVKEWLGRFGAKRIVLAFDIKLDKKNRPEVLTHGWQSGSELSLWEILKSYADSGLQSVLCTDVGRDGMMQGTNLDLYRLMRERWPNLCVLASGGVKNNDDLLALAKISVAGAVVGKAIYERRIDLAASIKSLAAMEKNKHAG